VGPGTEVVPVEYYRPTRGIDSYSRLSKIQPQFSANIINMMITDGVLESRQGVVEVGDTSTDIMAVFTFSSPDSDDTLVRLRLTGMDVWNGTTWFPVPGVVFSGGPSDRFTWVGWGNELLVTNGVDKIVSYNRLTGVASVLVESFPARQLTTFNNRVIASSVEEGGHLGYRIRWSVKNDNTDWTSERLLVPMILCVRSTGCLP
jgi:hypothetical protein